MFTYKRFESVMQHLLDMELNTNDCVYIAVALLLAIICATGLLACFIGLLVSPIIALFDGAWKLLYVIPYGAMFAGLITLFIFVISRFIKFFDEYDNV